MTAASIRAGRAEVELGVKDQLTKGLKGARAKLQKFAATTGKIGAGLTGAGAAILGPLALAVKSFASQGDKLDKMSKRLGISTERLSEMSFAAEQSGADLETFERATKDMTKRVRDLGRGLSTQTSAFGELGLQYKDLDGLSPDEQFKAIAKALSQVEDKGRKAALAQEVFGRSGFKLIPMLDNVEELTKQAKALGLTISGDAASSAADLTDAFNEGWRVLKNVAFVIGEALAPAITQVTRFVVPMVVAFSSWIKQNKTIVTIVAGVGIALVAAGGFFLALSGAATLAGFAISGVIAVLGLLASPVAVVGAAIAASAAALAGLALWSLHSGGELQNLLGIFKDTCGGIMAALQGGNLKLAGQIAFAGLKVAFFTGMDLIFNRWDSFMVKIGNAFLQLFNKLQEVLKNWVKNFISSIGTLPSKLKQIFDQALSGNIKGAQMTAAFAAVELGATLSKSLGMELNGDKTFGERIKENLEASKAELAELVAKAKELRNATTADQIKGSGLATPNTFSDSPAQKSSRAFTSGGFGRAALNISKVGGPEKAIEENTEKTVDVLEQIKEQLVVNGTY